MRPPFKSDSNSSMTMEQATQYHLSLNLEWLSGCQFSCKGCHVRKTRHGPDMVEINKLGKWINSMVITGKYRPTIVFLGPTDFLAAKNADRILGNIETWGIMRRFERLSLQSTFLNMDNADRIISILIHHYRHMELELNFILEPEQIKNEKYLETIKRNRDDFIRKLQWNRHIASFAIMNVYDYGASKKNDAKKVLADYQKLDALVKAKFGSTIDFNFSVLRKEWWSNDDVKESIQSVSKIFDEGVTSDFNQTVRFSFGKLEDSSIEKHYNWHQGDLYISPMIYERIASFHPKLKVPFYSNNLCRDTEDYERRLLLDQYHNSETKTECNRCRYQASCIERNVLTFMDMHEIKDCIIARKALDAINVI